MTISSHTILLVEDDPDQRVLATLALENSNLPVEVKSVGSGEMALHYLLGEDPFGKDFLRRTPALVILDLGLPGMSGFDVLRIMRETPELRSIPVLVLTISDEGKDRETALSFGARDFHLKPTDWSDLARWVADLLKHEKGVSAG